uniref:PB1 domain-containing protein n=1 Tax=Aegilops tauschii subsp. strangulata TaxID=200361 RepID=A0A453QJI4_AEGTS
FLSSPGSSPSATERRPRVCAAPPPAPPPRRPALRDANCLSDPPKSAAPPEDQRSRSHPCPPSPAKPKVSLRNNRGSMAEGGIVVAICQHGGEFTPGPNGNLVYKGGEAHAVDVSREMPLDSFKDEVSKVFHVDVTDMSFKYFLPNNNRTLITISCDRDLHRMVDFTASAAQVDVFVISTGENRSVVTYTGASTVKAGSNAQGDKRKRPASKNKASKSNKKTPNATGAAVEANTHDFNQPRPVETLNDYNEYISIATSLHFCCAFVATL